MGCTRAVYTDGRVNQSVYPLGRNSHRAFNNKSLGTCPIPHSPAPDQPQQRRTRSTKVSLANWKTTSRMPRTNSGARYCVLSGLWIWGLLFSFRYTENSVKTDPYPNGCSEHRLEIGGRAVGMVGSGGQAHVLHSNHVPPDRNVALQHPGFVWPQN